jgi:hypothetical protein
MEKIQDQCLNHWIRVKNTSSNILESNLCPTKIADAIRILGWLPVTGGVPIEGVTIPHPLHQFRITYLDSTLQPVNLQPSSLPHLNNDTEVDTESILFSCPQSCTPELLSSKGPYPHYIGSTTGEKKSGTIYQIPYSGRSLQAAKRLLQLKSWLVNPESNLSLYIDELAESRTNIPLPILKSATQQITGGSVVRLDDHVTKRGTLNNIRPNITSHIYFSTDQMGRFSRGAENYNMHFQGAIHLGFAAAANLAFCSKDHVKCIKLKYAGACCEEMLPDFTIQNEDQPPPVESNSGNPLLYSDYCTGTSFQAPRQHTLVKHVKCQEPSQAVAYLLLGRILSLSNIYLIGMMEKSAPTVGTISVAEVLGAGLKEIVSHLAPYFYLLLPRDKGEIDEILDKLNPHSFTDLSLICLLPEVLPHFREMISGHFVADLFTDSVNISLLLKHLVVCEISDILNSPRKQSTESTGLESQSGISKQRPRNTTAMHCT